MLSDPLEGLILEYLDKQRPYQTQFFNNAGITPGFIEFAKTKERILDPYKDEPSFREAFWRLVSKGLAVPGTGANGGSDNLPHVSITEYGSKCIKTGRLQVHDPRGYLDAIRQRVPNLDMVVEMYIAEALSSFMGMNYLASSVMIGCALEKTIFDSTKAFGERLEGEIRAEYDKDVLQRQKIKHRLDEYLSFLGRHGFKDGLDQTTKEQLESTFPAVANIIRITRNEIGHPTGRTIDQDEAEANLLLAKIDIIFIHELQSKLNPVLTD